MGWAAAAAGRIRSLAMSTTEESEIQDYCRRIAQAAKEASGRLATASGGVRDHALEILAESLRTDGGPVLEANARDLAAAKERGWSAAQMDRLRLDEPRLAEMARAVDEIRALPDPIGRTIESAVRPNGLEVRKVRVPLGVVLFIYESRPNVTTDAAALCIKSGNAVILRGGTDAWNSHQMIANSIRQGLQAAGLPPASVTMVETPDRQAVGALLALGELIDVAIPRGGEELIRRVAAEATMPVMKHFQGVCHVYVDESADIEMAARIVENSKCQRPGVCNAAETLLVHRAAAPSALPAIAERLERHGVEMRGCPASQKILPGCTPARADDFGKEFLDLILAVKVVDDLEDALAHIARYGSGHTDAIVTSDLAAARRFTAAVDSSAVLVNASTRFNDGGQFGLGAEIGISTDKFHARGPCGLNELTSYKYVVFGDGQIRT